MRKKVGKEAILRIVFSELYKGNTDLNIREIASKAGVSIGLMYYHFKDLDAVYEEIHALYLHNVDQILQPFKGKLPVLCYEITHQLMYIELNQLHPKISQLFINRLDSYFVYLKHAVESIFQEFGLHLSAAQLQIEARFYAGMLRGISQVLLKDSEKYEPVELVILIFNRMLSPYGVSSDIIEKCKPEALEIVKDAMKEKSISQWFFPKKQA
jgi:AcrR family transcriptional regulator